MFTQRMQSLQNRMHEDHLDVVLITDEDNVYYLTGYYDYLHMEFGRPTILIVSRYSGSLLITPKIDENTALAAARVDRIAAWNDGMHNEWREEIPKAVKGARYVGLEPDRMPPLVRRFVDTLVPTSQLLSVTPLLSDMRMIKSPKELQLARHAGQVAMAMMVAGREAIADGVPEFEVALATSQAGTRKAAKLLTAHYDDKDMSPNTHFLQIMASGDAITKSHHRASSRIMRLGEPVFLCFCGMTNFHRFKLGFDRTFWIGELAIKTQAKIYEVALASQEAALDALRPGVSADTVHAAYAEVIQSAGYDYPFRCGRATGFSFLEKPQLVTGDKTILQPGMVIAVDGSVSINNFRAQVGDSFIITDDGWEALTEHPKSLEEVII
ncbi:M24 family metallopeptidase [Pseudopelagicola sp. nBUS_20]|uniref:M24 family metallopeptidase n=1 Tax=Pseudopelagicola sp. nBUS_20 TaxID=3395317 RepID=UPI003EBB5D05